MINLFSPLRQPRIGIVFAVTLVLAGALSILSRPATMGGARLASALLLSVGLAALAAALTAFFTDRQPDRRVESLRGVDRATKRKIHRAVVRDGIAGMTPAEQALCSAYADAYVASTPRAISPIVLLLVGGLTQGLSQLVRWDGGWATLLQLAQIVFVAAALTIGIPLQVRWLRNAARLAGVGASTADNGTTL